MSHWNLQVTIGNKDKEMMRGVVALPAKWHLLTAKLDNGRNCSSAQERGGNYKTTADSNTYRVTYRDKIGCLAITSNGSIGFSSPSKW